MTKDSKRFSRKLSKMKFQSTAGALNSALKIVTFVTEPRSTIPITSCVKFSDKTIVGTDLDVEVSVDVPADYGKGEICILARPLKNLLSAIPVNTVVTITNSDEGAKITFGDSCYSLSSIPADDFPDIWRGKDVADVIFQTVDECAGFVAGLKSVASSISTEETRYYLNGVCLDFKNDQSWMVATDGHRMTWLPMKFNLTGQHIIPTKTVKLMTLIGIDPTQIRMSDNSMMNVGYPGVKIRSKLIDGSFPNWTRFIPDLDKINAIARIPVRETVAALRRLNSIQSNSFRRCDVYSDLNGGAISTIDNNGNIGREIISELSSNKEISVNINLKYLFQSLKVFANQDTLELYWMSSAEPLHFRVEGCDIGHTIMPLRYDTDISKSFFNSWLETQDSSAETKQNSKAA